MSEDIYAVVGRDGKPLRGRAYLKKGYATLSAKANYQTQVRKGRVVWNDSEDEVIISVEDYDALQHSANFLQCLEDAGVDNWGGIDYAYEMMNKGVDFDEL